MTQRFREGDDEDEDEVEAGADRDEPGAKELTALFECKARHVAEVEVIRANHASKLRDEWLEAQITRLNRDPSKAPTSGFMAESTDDERSNTGLAVVGGVKKEETPEEDIKALFGGPLSGLEATLETAAITDRWRVLAMLRYVATRLSDSMQDDLMGARMMEEALTADYMAAKFVSSPKLPCVACLFEQCVPAPKPGVAPTELQATFAMMKSRMKLRKRDVQLQAVLASGMFNSTVLPVMKSVRKGMLGAINTRMTKPTDLTMSAADMATHMKDHMPENRERATHLSMSQDNARLMAAINGYGMGYRDKSTGAVSVNLPAVRAILSIQTQQIKIAEAESRADDRMRALEERSRALMPPPSATGSGGPRRKKQGHGGGKVKRRGR